MASAPILTKSSDRYPVCPGLARSTLRKVLAGRLGLPGTGVVISFP